MQIQPLRLSDVGYQYYNCIVVFQIANQPQIKYVFQ